MLRSGKISWQIFKREVVKISRMVTVISERRGVVRTNVNLALEFAGIELADMPKMDLVEAPLYINSPKHLEQ